MISYEKENYPTETTILDYKSQIIILLLKINIMKNSINKINNESKHIEKYKKNEYFN